MRREMSDKESRLWDCSLNQKWNTPSTLGQDSAAKLDCFPVQLSSMNQTAKILRKIRLWEKKMNQRFKDSVSSGGICQCPDSSIHSFYPSVETMV